MNEGERNAAGQRRQTGRGPPVDNAVDHELEEEGEQQLDDDRRKHRVRRRGMISPWPLAAKPSESVNPALPLAITYSTADAAMAPTTWAAI